MWQKRVWQNTARLPNGFRSTTSLTPLLFILTNLSWKVLLFFSSWRLTIFFVIWWRPIGQCFWLWKLVACWWQVYNCRPAALSPLCPCGSFYPIKLKLTSTCFPTRSNIYWICLLKTPSTTIGNVMICVIFNSQQTLAMYRYVYWNRSNSDNNSLWHIWLEQL